MNKAIIERCPVGCEGTLEITDIILPEGALRRCSCCGQLISSCTQERYDETMQDFNVDEGTMPAGKTAIRHHRRIGGILKEAASYLSKDMTDISFLDVGCSSGSVLKIAKAIGITSVQGVEPATKAAKTAQKLGYDVVDGYLDDAGFADESFDVLSLFEVIEHLSNAGPMADEVSRVLRPGGLWLVGTANAESWTANNLREKWEYFSIAQNGGHISFFNPRSIRQLAQRHGYSVAYIHTKRVLHNTPASRSPFDKMKDEVMALPARLTGRGHDMLVALQKNSP